MKFNHCSTCCSLAAGLLSVIVTAVPSSMRAAEPDVAERPFPEEHEMFGVRQPREENHEHFGHVGVTGLLLRFHPGRVLIVERVLPDTPAAGRFAPGDVIAGVNGIALEGNSAYIVLGASLTEAEAGDGRLVFDVRDGETGEPRTVKLDIPVLGAYSETWPLNCPKSDRIVARAAEYYANRRLYADGGHDEELRPEAGQTHGIGGALAALFLLSTGDDQYLPRVKEYVDHLASNIEGIGDHTWNNGYNGILVAEYYLRTGDATALPVLQYYVDDARDRQYYGVGWGHWGRTVSPRYVGGGLMNPAGSQLVTTLLLGRECGVEVDEETLLGALRYWYRFVGRGSVPYGDHRGEGGLGSNGKDGMAAAMMQVATGAQGNVEIYRQARDHLGMATLISYPSLVAGHADNGRGDGIWRGIVSSYRLEAAPEDYHAIMNRMRWWFDLSRRPDGGIGMAMNTRFDDVGSGAGVALAYTAPRRTLRITGAPPSEHARPFMLPERLWGREADRAFHRVEHGEPYHAYGEAEPVHVPFRKLGSAYAEPGADLPSIRDEILRNVHHASYVIRAQAGKALLRIGALDELERLLDDPDPRVRRAGLDGLTDYRFWFAIGRNPARSDQVSPAMITSMRRMLTDPEEALFVVDGALMALSRAHPEVIAESLPLVMPWATHEEWWIRQSAFAALSGIAGDDGLLPQVLPTMVAMLNNEGRTQARAGMQNEIARILRRNPTDGPVGAKAFAGLLQAVAETPIRPGPRSGEGRYYVTQAALTALQESPGNSVAIADAFERRFAQLRPGDIEQVTQRLLQMRADLSEEVRAALTARLIGDYRREFLRVMEADEADVPLDTLVALVQLERPEVDWQVLGGIDPADRVWQFTSFAPEPEDELPSHIGKRFRDVTMPERLDGWFRPEYDPAGWETGRAPIGKGVFRGRGRDGVTLENRSDWGDGEFIVLRGEFEIDDPGDYDFFRLRVLANQGFRVHLNGHAIHTYIWWKNNPEYRPIRLDPDHAAHAREGANLLAIYANTAYVDGEQVGQIDAYLEGLKKSDLTGGGAR